MTIITVAEAWEDATSVLNHLIRLGAYATASPAPKGAGPVIVTYRDPSDPEPVAVLRWLSGGWLISDTTGGEVQNLPGDTHPRAIARNFWNYTFKLNAA